MFTDDKSRLCGLEFLMQVLLRINAVPLGVCFNPFMLEVVIFGIFA